MQNENNKVMKTAAKNTIIKTVDMFNIHDTQFKETVEVDIVRRKVKLHIAVQELHGNFQTIKEDRNGEYITRDRMKLYFKTTEGLFN